MTRGTLYLILKKGVVGSTEFNGDMYPEGHGDMTLKLLRTVKDVPDFIKILKKINKVFGYPLEEVEKTYKVDQKHDKPIDFNIKYYDRFFSDWVFFKNLTDKTVKFVTTDSRKIVNLKPNETIRFPFGYMIDKDDYKFGKKLMTKTLEECQRKKK